MTIWNNGKLLKEPEIIDAIRCQVMLQMTVHCFLISHQEQYALDSWNYQLPATISIIGQNSEAYLKHKKTNLRRFFLDLICWPHYWLFHMYFIIVFIFVWF